MCIRGDERFTAIPHTSAIFVCVLYGDARICIQTSAMFV